MFSILSEMNFNFEVTFILWSAKALNLDRSKVLSFGKHLRFIDGLSISIFLLVAECFQSILSYFVWKNFTLLLLINKHLTITCLVS